MTSQYSGPMTVQHNLQQQLQMHSRSQVVQGGVPPSGMQQQPPTPTPQHQQPGGMSMMQQPGMMGMHAQAATAMPGHHMKQNMIQQPQQQQQPPQQQQQQSMLHQQLTSNGRYPPWYRPPHPATPGAAASPGIGMGAMPQQQPQQMPGQNVGFNQSQQQQQQHTMALQQQQQQQQQQAAMQQQAMMQQQQQQQQQQAPQPQAFVQQAPPQMRPPMVGQPGQLNAMDMQQVMLQQQQQQQVLAAQQQRQQWFAARLRGDPVTTANTTAPGQSATLQHAQPISRGVRMAQPPMGVGMHPAQTTVRGPAQNGVSGTAAGLMQTHQPDERRLTLDQHSQLQEEDDLDDEHGEKQVATARFRRNHRLMADIFSDVALPIDDEFSGMSAEDLRSMKESLEAKTVAMSQDIATLEAEYSEVRRKAADSKVSFEKSLQATSAPPLSRQSPSKVAEHV